MAQFWIIAGIISLIIETGVGTLDFLDLGLAAIILGFLIHLNPNIGTDPVQQGIIFGIISIILLILTRVFVTPKMKNNLQDKLMSQDNLIGQTLNVNIYNSKPVVFFEGIYWNIVSKDAIQKGDIVKVVARDGSKLVVEKI